MLDIFEKFILDIPMLDTLILIVDIFMVEMFVLMTLIYSYTFTYLWLAPGKKSGTDLAENSRNRN